MKDNKYLSEFCKTGNSALCNLLNIEIEDLLNEEKEVENEIQQQQQQQQQQQKQKQKQRQQEQTINIPNNIIALRSLSINNILDFNEEIFNSTGNNRNFIKIFRDGATVFILSYTNKFYFNFNYSTIKYNYFILKDTSKPNKYILLDSEDYAVIKSYIMDLENRKSNHNYEILSSSKIEALPDPRDNKTTRFENFLCGEEKENSKDSLT